MNDLISICIPTYKRPDILREAVESCVAQEYDGPLEIVIGDDSPGDETERIINSLPSRFPIRYFHHRPSLKQAENVNSLFDQALGDRLVLLHDDDLLLPNAIRDLAACWEGDPGLVAAYGKQLLMSHTGEIDEAGSERMSRDYFKVGEHGGRQPSAMWAALVQQFPNDAYMVRTDSAREVRLASNEMVGVICDFEFGLRLAKAHGRFHYLNKYTAIYRLNPVGENNTDHCHNIYQVLNTLDVPEDLKNLRRQRLRAAAPLAVNSYLRAGKTKEALRVFTSADYSLAEHLSPRGLAHIVLLLLPPPVSRTMARRRQAAA
jgi:glycosyltransferase involved in cell wall biosynthesis